MVLPQKAALIFQQRCFRHDVQEAFHHTAHFGLSISSSASVMLLAGVTQCRIRSSRANEPDAAMASWSLPAFVVPRHRNYYKNTPFDGHYVLLHPRIAVPLHIGDGDQVTLEFTETAGETFSCRVHVHSGTSFWNCDIMIHGAHEALYACAVGNGDNCIVKLHSGTELAMPFQEMWNGLASPGGFGCLYLCGIDNADNTSGPAGCGFHINANARQGVSVRGFELVKGYVFLADSQTNHTAEVLYWGFMEGLEWACRLRLSQLCICADSSIFLQQMAATGDCHANHLPSLEPRERQLLDFVHISMVLSEGMNFTFHPIHREENEFANGLAHTAIHVRENATICNWPNIDLLGYTYD